MGRIVDGIRCQVRTSNSLAVIGGEMWQINGLNYH
jgi:hypothetical protein